MPAYNAEKFIAGSIESVQQQTHSSWELIVVDDGSTDATASVVKDMQSQDNRIRYYCQSNKKQAAARNTGVTYSNGDWIAFFDADDLWEPSKLSTQLAYTKKIDADVFFTGGHIIDEEGKIVSEYKTIYGLYTGIELYKKLYANNPVPVLSVLLKKSCIEKVGPQDASLKMQGCEDWDYWIRLAYNQATFYGINEKLFRYRINPQGTSRKVLQMRVAECLALYKNLDFRLFTDAEKVGVKQRFDNLIKFIINELYGTVNPEAIMQYLQLLVEIKGSIKYKAATYVYKLLGSQSRRLVNFILYH